jgi:hypothetical protein
MNLFSHINTPPTPVAAIFNQLILTHGHTDNFEIFLRRKAFPLVSIEAILPECTISVPLHYITIRKSPGRTVALISSTCIEDNT